jgi:hypothetical protein
MQENWKERADKDEVRGVRKEKLRSTGTENIKLVHHCVDFAFTLSRTRGQFGCDRQMV